MWAQDCTHSRVPAVLGSAGVAVPPGRPVSMCNPSHQNTALSPRGADMCLPCPVPQCRACPAQSPWACWCPVHVVTMASEQQAIPTLWLKLPYLTWSSGQCRRNIAEDQVCLRHELLASLGSIQVGLLGPTCRNQILFTFLLI